MIDELTGVPSKPSGGNKKAHGKHDKETDDEHAHRVSRGYPADKAGRDAQRVECVDGRSSEVTRLTSTTPILVSRDRTPASQSCLN